MSSKNNFVDFEYRESKWSALRSIFYSYIFKKITSRSQNLFLRAGDIISVYPQVKGMHEPELASLLDSISKIGFSDFLIDVGANLGLTSCQSGSLFSVVHMFEPNPLCCHILEVNSAMALQRGKFVIHKYGLGDENQISNLKVPKRNWGGAFVKDLKNSYDDSILAKKDGYGSIDEKNYFEVEIELRRSADELKSIFDSLELKQLKKGVIKIDVEGYEPIVLKGISESLPKGMSVYIIFESWDPKFTMQEIVDLFPGRGAVGILEKNVPKEQGWQKILEIIFMVFGFKPSATLKKIDNFNKGYVGDIVIKVE